MVSGLFLAAIGAVVVIAALDIKSVFGERLPPRALPISLGAITILTGILLSIRAYLYKGEALIVDWPDREGWIRLIVTVLYLAIYVYLIDILGIAVSSLVFCFVLIYYLERRWIRALCVGIATAVIIQVVFVKILQLSLPGGFWVG